ncbi:hypothetical protein KUV78_12330 [Marinobacter hydrocarbonoclasticus]|uniref:DUF5677 domain-containing protein n=1 Tax=Marinobacter nauticus TaxID=2743 RepID=UPI001C97B338|nr:DUF5677 domain-containing protein [Marinobacter nauticus]MBY6194579.1 hypothetical protein [Marinobacter nauticus]MBY6215727.1 hypothetical protein [Marinobacter nauticus]
MSDWSEIRRQLEALFGRAYEGILASVETINFDSNNPQHVLGLSLYCSLVELCPSLLLIVQKGQFIAVPHLVRAMLEADVDLINSLQDEDYHNHLGANYIQRMIGIVQRAHNIEDVPFLSAVGGIDELRKFLGQKRKELADLKGKGFPPLNVGERFDKANRSSEYVSVYSFLSGFSHNDISALEDRHMRAEGDSYKIVLFEELGEANEVHLLDLAVAVLIGSSGRIHEFFSTGKFAEINQYMEELNKLREAWPAEGK